MGLLHGPSFHGGPDHVGRSKGVLRFGLIVEGSKVEGLAVDRDHGSPALIRVRRSYTAWMAVHRPLLTVTRLRAAVIWGI